MRKGEPKYCVELLVLKCAIAHIKTLFEHYRYYIIASDNLFVNYKRVEKQAFL